MSQTLANRLEWLGSNAVPGLIFLILCVVLVQSARLGAAGFLVSVGQEEIDRWKSSRQKYGMPEINRIAEGFMEGLRYLPDNPWALENLGALDLARMRLSRSPKDALGRTRDAYVRFKQALRQRPTSPFLWANLMMAKLYLDEIDVEFFSAMRNAVELGPWESSIQESVLFAGLAAWERLEPDLRKSVTDALMRGGERNAKGMFDVVKSFRRLDLVCGMKGYDVISEADCRNVSKPPRPGLANRKGNR